MRSLWLTLLLAALITTPAAAQSAYPSLEPDPAAPLPTLRLGSLQALDPAITFSANWSGGTPETWSVRVVQPRFREAQDHRERPERLLGQGSGSGATTSFALPLADQALRWEFLPITDIYVEAHWTWTEGGQTREAMWGGDLFLSMYVDAGRSGGALHGTGGPQIHNSHPVWTSPDPEAALAEPPAPDWVAFGKAVSQGLGASSFRSGRRLRPSAQVPWTVPPEGSSDVKVTVKFPKGRNPGFGIPVYTGGASPVGAPGTSAPIKVKLTAKGKQLVKRLGAGKVAAKLASRGIVSYDFQPNKAGWQRLLVFAPIGTCYYDHQRPSSFPCSQTCPPFPGQKKGYLMYTTTEIVYGSDTCTKGDPVPPIVFY